VPHDHEDDHDHGDDELDPLPPSETVQLVSVGIDVGSATSHVIFSALTMERQGRQLSSRYEVVARDVVARSPIWLTPYTDPDTIDADRLAELVASGYEAAGIAPKEVDTGAVIITGEAARKANAERIVSALAEHAGQFVCATAGPVLEGVLAAHGSGALAASRDGTPVLNVDIGGGTTKLTLLRDGHVEHVHAVNVGGRLIAWDEYGRVTRVERAGQRIAAAAGVEVRLGDVVTADSARRIAETAAGVLFDCLPGGPSTGLAAELAITPALPGHDVRRVSFSGGVGSLVATDAQQFHGDLGAPLARAILDRLAGAEWQVRQATETVRATVVGVGQFTVQLSGNTVHVGDRSVLPLHNLQVVDVRDVPLDSASGAAAAIGSGLARGERVDGDGSLALSLRLGRIDSPAAVNAVAGGITAALGTSLAAGFPLVVVIDQDIAAILGSRLAELSHCRAVVVIDQILVAELDFVDIGTVHEESGSVPVVVKSLVF
jgi:ethanolamine utilization protein EutA